MRIYRSETRIQNLKNAVGRKIISGLGFWWILAACLAKAGTKAVGLWRWMLRKSLFIAW